MLRFYRVTVRDVEDSWHCEGLNVHETNTRHVIV